MGVECRVVAVCAGPAHGPRKPPLDRIELVAGRGVAGDAHFGRTVQHRSRARAHPGSENLRQVHLIGIELHEELAERGLEIAAGEMGENVLTRGVDLLGLPTGTVVRLGSEAAVVLTGLRNPCRQLDEVRPGLMAAVLDRADDGQLVRRAGVMAIVHVSGEVCPGDRISLERPDAHRPLRPV